MLPQCYIFPTAVVATCRFVTGWFVHGQILGQDAESSVDKRYAAAMGLPGHQRISGILQSSPRDEWFLSADRAKSTTTRSCTLEAQLRAKEPSSQYASTLIQIKTSVGIIIYLLAFIHHYLGMLQTRRGSGSTGLLLEHMLELVC